jgi:hypothetical protein
MNADKKTWVIGVHQRSSAAHNDSLSASEGAVKKCAASGRWQAEACPTNAGK